MLGSVLLRPFRVARAEASRRGGPQLTLLWAPQASIRVNLTEKGVALAARRAAQFAATPRGGLQLNRARCCSPLAATRLNQKRIARFLEESPSSARATHQRRVGGAPRTNLIANRPCSCDPLGSRGPKPLAAEGCTASFAASLYPKQLRLQSLELRASSAVLRTAGLFAQRRSRSGEWATGRSRQKKVLLLRFVEPPGLRRGIFDARAGRCSPKPKELGGAVGLALSCSFATRKGRRPWDS